MHGTPLWTANLLDRYTSGSTGTPKGVLHTTGGYMVQAYVSTRYVFDTQPGDVFWCAQPEPACRTPQYLLGSFYRSHRRMCEVGVRKTVHSGWLKAAELLTPQVHSRLRLGHGAQ